MTQDPGRPADLLGGMSLTDGWTVGSKLTRKPGSTGGHFSVGYVVEHTSGRRAFLKALDFSEAQKAPDVARGLEAMLAAYNFERDLLDKCRAKGLRRIMVPLADGCVNVPGFGLTSNVYYLIFEMARGDVRNVISELDKLDVVFCLSTLHHVSVGLAQLHGNGIAHQDLKPSNVLISAEEGSKLGDLGRSADRERRSAVDLCQVPGDTSYAPLDLLYPGVRYTMFDERFLIDLYHLGSLIFFLFTGVPATTAIRIKLRGVPIGGQSLVEDMPLIQTAFNDCLRDLRTALEQHADREVAAEVVAIARQLCEPDPAKRGDPGWASTVVPATNLQRYVSRFDFLARKARTRV